ncbi:hypothetical protein CRE_11421 [Caenorhabditis remanei]|uniref:F-box domain-containing protein n=1 Tax=Caenorhabditis remanei TaxID=31234 RepID=E3NBD1_CAERE|nr:hypothetical protein CRE_11421 [Caenorhabditis remanei]
MTDFIINNPMSLRRCILYEFTKGKKPFETYKELMKRLGDDFMNYPEFEFWFMRFSQANFGLRDISQLDVSQPRHFAARRFAPRRFAARRFAAETFRSQTFRSRELHSLNLEPKKRKITDLPVDVFEKVGDYLDFKDRNRLRNVSKDIQFLVDNWNPKITEITYYRFQQWSIEQNSKSFKFWNCMRQEQLPTVARILKNPKLRLKKLTVYPDETWMKTREELRESSTKLHVSSFIVKNSHGTIDLSLLAPESLEEVSLHINDKSVKKMNEILQSKHCKQLKMLTISTDLSPSNFPFGSFIGYPRFTIRIHPNRSEVNITEFIKKLIKCTQLELFKLEFTTYDYTPTWESIKEYLSQKDTLVPDSPNIRHYPIQGSTDFYEINLGGSSISIERKS